MRAANPYWLSADYCQLRRAHLPHLSLAHDDRNDNPPPFYPTFFANTVGYMLSTVLPIRAGDVARPALLSRRTERPVRRRPRHRAHGAHPRPLCAPASLHLLRRTPLERLREDHAWLLMRSGAIGCLIVIGALTVLVGGIYFFREKMRRVHEWLARFVPKRFRGAWMHFYDAFVETLKLRERPAAVFKVVGCTIAIWFCLTAQFWVTTVAMPRHLPFDSSLFISGVTTLGLRFRRLAASADSTRSAS